MNVNDKLARQRIEDRLAEIQSKLRWIVDALIPADLNLGMPSASEAAVPETYLQLALEARPQDLNSFVAIVSRLPDSPTNGGLEVLMALPAPDLDVIGRLVAGGYFLNPQVTDKLGFKGQEALDYNPDYDEIMEVVERIQERGDLYIPTPPA